MHTIRELLTVERPLLLPCAHDALSARLIEASGFSAFSIGGFGVAGTRYGLPDLGLASFGELSDAVRDIIGSVSIPVLVDGDDGYGDVKNVTRTVRVYEAMGAAGVILEDQAYPKRCGHMEGKRVVPSEQAEHKLAAALAARRSDDFFVVARTDARAVHGLDEAIRRARRFEAIGADAVFVEAPESVDELAAIGESFHVPILVNAAEKGRTPVLHPQEYGRLGFSLIGYPSTVLLRVLKATREGLDDIRNGLKGDRADLPSFDELTDAFRLDDWRAIERGQQG